jgi:hypothetical protein
MSPQQIEGEKSLPLEDAETRQSATPLILVLAPASERVWQRITRTKQKVHSKIIQRVKTPKIAWPRESGSRSVNAGFCGVWEQANQL